MSTRAQLGRLALAMLAVFACTVPARAATFSVTNTNDSGPGSLRQAILDSRATEGPHVIEFDLPAGTSPALIFVERQFLPPLRGPLVLRVKSAAVAAAAPPAAGRGAGAGGTGAAGAADTPAPPPPAAIAPEARVFSVVLDGSRLVRPRTPEDCPGATTSYNAQSAQWEQTRVQGTGPNVRGYYGAGLAVHDTNHVEISDIEIRNFCIGVAVVRSHDVIIDNIKVMDSHGAAGVIFTGDDGDAASTEASHDNMLLNSVLVDNGDGFEFTRGTRDSLLQATYIALTQPLPADGNAVEYASSGDNNALMGNTFTKYVSTAVTVGSGANHTIRDNRIVENTGDGMRVDSENALVFGNTFAANGGDALVVGGARTRVVDNVVTGNQGRGIAVGGPGITVSRNSIYDNGRLGIDLAAPAASAPLVLPNPPLLSESSRWTDTELVLIGTLEGRPGQRYQIQLFVSREADRHQGDESGWGEGEKYIGTAVAITDGTGRASFRLMLKVPDIFGDGRATGVVTATATDPAGSTSKFSRSLPVTQRPGG
jgi:3-dehydroshikimate dehydratase